MRFWKSYLPAGRSGIAVRYLIAALAMIVVVGLVLLAGRVLFFPNAGVLYLLVVIAIGLWLGTGPAGLATGISLAAIIFNYGTTDPSLASFAARFVTITAATVAGITLTQLVRQKQGALQAQSAAIRRQNEVLQGQTEELQAQAEELQSQSEEIQAQNEELRITNESLLQMQRGLTESEKRYRTIGELIPFGISECDPAGGVIYLSDSFLELVGKTLDECREFGWLDRLPPEDVERTIRDWTHHVETGELWDYEHHILGADGQYRTVLSRGVPVRDTQGSITSWVGINLDITQRKQAEADRARLLEEVQFSEEQLRTMADAIPQLVWMAQPDGFIFWYNRRWYEYTGTTPEQMEGWGWQSVHDPEMLPAVLERWRASIATGEPFEMEFPLRGADGRFRWFLTRVMPLKDAEGSVVRWFGTNTDVSEKREDEQALRESEERLREHTRLLDLAHILIRDAKSRIVTWNSGAEALYGFSKDEAIGQVSHDLFQTVFPESDEAVNEALAETGHWQGELVHTAKDGRRVVVASHQVLQRDEEGRPVAILEVNNDVTALKQAEEDLRQTEAELKDAQRVAHVGSWYWKANTDATTTSEELYRIVGLDPERPFPAFGEQEGLIYPPDSYRQLSAAVQEAVHTGIGYELDVEAIRADGATIWITTRGEVVRDPNGGIVGLSGTFQDITERKRAEAEREQLLAEIQHHAAELAEANKELEAFTYSVAHDLRSPVRHMDGFSKALMERYADKLDERGQQYLRFVREGSVKMGQLIDDLLALTGVTRSEVHRTAVDLSEMAQVVASELQREQPARQVDFVIAPGVVANADPRLMRVALDNLLGNAWKFTAKHERARIELGVRSEGGRTVYFVRDDGAGFNMAFADKLFRAFQRLHNEEEFPGTGIGLATVERIIRRHGGRVWAEGETDKGATFYFTLS